MKLSCLLLCLYAAVSLIAFCLYGIDKLRARRRAWRIKESLLLSLAFFGGAAGAILGMFTFHHKTRHWYFWAVAVLGAVWQIGLILFLAVCKGL